MYEEKSEKNKYGKAFECFITIKQEPPVINQEYSLNLQNEQKFVSNYNDANNKFVGSNIKTEDSVSSKTTLFGKGNNEFNDYTGVKSEQLEVKPDIEPAVEIKPLHVLLCDICRQPSTTAAHLVAHRYTHTEDTNFTCLICYKIFVQKRSVPRHMQYLHSVLRPYACDICHKLFKQCQDLLQHKNIHTGEKAYNCTICHKRFNRNGELGRHMLIHTLERPYQCDKCHRRYRQSSHLAKHNLMHTGEQPYECGICLKRYKSNSYLTKHKRIFHANE